MAGPIETGETEILEFDPDSVPIPYYRMREMPAGWLACRYNWSIPFDASAREILAAIDGKTRLSDLYTRHGENILEIIGCLYRGVYRV